MRLMSGTRLPALARAAAIATAVLALSRVSAQTLPTLEPLDSSGRVTYFVADGLPGSRYQPDDRQLAEWALKAWERSVGGPLRFEPSSEAEALVRVYWVPAGDGRYGEMRSFRLNGRTGAAVFIRPDTRLLDPEVASAAALDPLLRDSVVYLTCLHELGHALGLSHTADFSDVMYYFGYGGDIPAFFTRYRAQLARRDDIARVSGLSRSDGERAARLYRRAP